MSRVIHNGLSTGAPGYRVDDPSVSPVPLHGGRLNAAAARYGIPREQWLDLSTGINPNGWPVPSLPAQVFSRLPEEDDGLAQSGPARTGGLYPAYAEHAFRWRHAGHSVQPLTADQIASRLDDLDVLVLINPCNPSGIRFSVKQLQCWHERQSARGCRHCWNSMYRPLSSARRCLPIWKPEGPR